MKKEASKTGDKVLLDEFKAKAREVKKLVNKDKKAGQENALGVLASSSQAWRAARSVLGIKKTLSPTSVKDKDGKLISNPSHLASMFNNFFMKKVRLLREKTNRNPKIDPVTRLNTWLEKSGKAPPPFSLNPITKQKLRKLIKRMKGNRTCGIDNIDSYSLLRMH